MAKLLSTLIDSPLSRLPASGTSKVYCSIYSFVNIAIQLVNLSTLVLKLLQFPHCLECSISEINKLGAQIQHTLNFFLFWMKAVRFDSHFHPQPLFIIEDFPQPQPNVLIYRPFCVLPLAMKSQLMSFTDCNKALEKTICYLSSI